MTATLTDDTATFIRLLTEQRGLYQRVQETGGRQAELIENGDTQGLLAVLSERQKLIETLGQLNQRLIPHREVWSRTVEKAEPDLRRRVKGLIDETQELLDAILARDEADRKNLQSRFKRLGEQLHENHNAGRAVSAYGRRPGTPAPRMTDQQG